MGGLLLGGLLLFLRRLCSCCRGRKAIGVCLFFSIWTILCGRRRLVFGVHPTVFSLRFLSSSLGLVHLCLDQLVDVVDGVCRRVDEIQTFYDHIWIILCGRRRLVFGIRPTVFLLRFVSSSLASFSPLHQLTC